MVLSGGAPGTNHGTTAFSVAQVTRYWDRHAIPALADGVVAGHIARHRVTKVRFLTSGAVSRMVRSSLERPEGYPVCYVELRGTFAVPVPPDGPHAPSKSLIFGEAILVLDARTGSVLLSGQVPFSAASIVLDASGYRS